MPINTRLLRPLLKSLYLFVMDHLQKTPLISYKEEVSYFPSAVPRQVDTDTNTANETANSKYSKYEILNLIIDPNTLKYSIIRLNTMQYILLHNVMCIYNEYNQEI